MKYHFKGERMLNREILEHFFDYHEGTLKHYFKSLDFSCEQEKEYFRLFVLMPLLENLESIRERELEAIDKVAEKFAQKEQCLNNPLLNFYKKEAEVRDL